MKTSKFSKDFDVAKSEALAKWDEIRKARNIDKMFEIWADIDYSLCKFFIDEHNLGCRKCMGDRDGNCCNEFVAWDNAIDDGNFPKAQKLADKVYKRIKKLEGPIKGGSE
jgi:hypothetical protein